MLPDEHCPECGGYPGVTFAGKLSLRKRCTVCDHEWREERSPVATPNPKTPAVPHKRTNKPVNITLPPWARERLDQLAAERGLTVSGVVQALLAESIKREKRVHVSK